MKNNTPMSTNCSSSSALVESLNSQLQGIPPLIVTLILLSISFIIAAILIYFFWKRSKWGILEREFLSHKKEKGETCYVCMGDVDLRASLRVSISDNGIFFIPNFLSRFFYRCVFLPYEKIHFCNGFFFVSVKNDFIPFSIDDTVTNPRAYYRQMIIGRIPPSNIKFGVTHRQSLFMNVGRETKEALKILTQELEKRRFSHNTTYDSH
jgi:hypothetical protein